MKIKKKKYVGGCDNPSSPEESGNFESLPIFTNFDYTRNGAYHLKHDGIPLNIYDYPDFANDIYKVKYLMKI